MSIDTINSGFIKVCSGVLQEYTYDLTVFKTTVFGIKPENFVIRVNDKYVLFSKEDRDGCDLFLDVLEHKRIKYVELSRYNLKKRKSDVCDNRSVNYQLFYFDSDETKEIVKNFPFLTRDEQAKFALSHKYSILLIENPPKDLVMAHSLKFKL